MTHDALPYEPPKKVLTDEQCRESIIAGRIKMLLQHPFFGNLATRLQLKNADELGIPTAATDGRNFCLLYTSPSPRDLSTSRMPSSA